MRAYKEHPLDNSGGETAKIYAQEAARYMDEIDEIFENLDES